MSSFLAALSLALPARANGELPVLLELERCDDLDEAEVRRVVAAELGAVATNASGPSVTHVVVTCNDARVTVRVQDPLSRKALQRTFNLGLSEPRARARLLAIASAELVLASWAELEANPHLHVEPEGPSPPKQAQRAALEVVQERFTPYEPRLKHWYDAETPDDRMMRVLAVGSARSFFRYPGTLLGGGFRLGEDRFRFIGWSADALFERGTIEAGANPIDLSTFTTGGSLFAYFRSGAFTARLGAGLRLGLAITPGSPSVAPWGWPLGASSMSLRFGAALIELSGEASYVVLPAEGAREPTTLRGPWFSAQAGLGVVLP